MSNKEKIQNQLKHYQEYLENEEKSKSTVEKYLRDVKKFLHYLNESDITKQNVIHYKKYLAAHYKTASANSMLTALNHYLKYAGYEECTVKVLRVQQQIFTKEEREMTVADYQRLVQSAKDSRISYVIQTICETGIRVSELEYITVEAVEIGKAVVDCKNKRRVILLSERLQNMLKEYIKKNGVITGSVFVTKAGTCLNRSNIWRDMKRLCKKAGVDERKVYPHNLRHLFARGFYAVEKDLVKLADVLGHSNINTTRIYTIETGRNHLKTMEQVHQYLMT